MANGSEHSDLNFCAGVSISSPHDAQNCDICLWFCSWTSDCSFLQSKAALEAERKAVLVLSLEAGRKAVVELERDRVKDMVPQTVIWLCNLLLLIT